MAIALQSECKKCNKVTRRRLVKSSKGDYTTCVICSEANSKRHRQKYWLKYLAQKANARKREGSEKMTEAILTAVCERQNYRCALTNIAFNMELAAVRPSLDRVSSDLGYTKDNIQLVLKDINKIKMDFTMPYFFSLCLLVANNYDPSIKLIETEEVI